MAGTAELAASILPCICHRADGILPVDSVPQLSSRWLGYVVHIKKFNTILLLYLEYANLFAEQVWKSRQILLHYALDGHNPVRLLQVHENRHKFKV